MCSMRITVKTGTIEKEKTDALVIPIFEGEKLGPLQAKADKLVGGTVQRLIKQGAFTPKTGAVSLLYPAGNLSAERLLLMGVGKRKGFSLGRLRQAVGAAAPYLRTAGAHDIVFTGVGIDLDPEEAAQAVVRHAQRDLKIGRLTALVSPENRASIGLIEKLGFSYEATIRIPGEDSDVSCYSKSLAGED